MNNKERIDQLKMEIFSLSKLSDESRKLGFLDDYIHWENEKRKIREEIRIIERTDNSL